MDKDGRRLAVQVESWRSEARHYSDFADKLARMLALKAADFDKHRWQPEELIAQHAMGDANSVHDLQNYVIGPRAAAGFETVNYFSLLANLSARNNVQAGVGSHPVDFIAMRIQNPEDARGEPAVWLYGSEDRQAIIFSRHQGGNLELRYQPLRRLRQDANGAITFDGTEFAAGFPLHLWEDPSLAVVGADRSQWLTEWHSEQEWFRAVHKTTYSNGIIALHEQFLSESEPPHLEGDALLLARFNARRRRLADPDFLIFANNHWNFNVRGFNPGGNHGSFRRISSHSVLMLAGGEQTGIPRGGVIEEPYDSLSLVPTLLDLLNRHSEAQRLPGKPIEGLLPKTKRPGTR